MGYSSNIAAAFYDGNTDTVDVLKLWLRENFSVAVWEELGATLTWTKWGMLFEVEDVKWYSDYTEVIAFNDLVNKYIDTFIDNDGTNADDHRAYEFIRIGENDDDIEIIREGRCDYILDVHRSIQVNR